MAGATLNKTWREVRKELYTPEEIAASDVRVKLAIASSNEEKTRNLTQKNLSEMSRIKQPVISRLKHDDTYTQIDSFTKTQIVPLDA